MTFWQCSFYTAWEQRKFGDLYKKVSEKNDGTYGADKIISVANMYYKSDAKISGKNYLKTYNIFKVGDIAFEGNKSKHFAHGRFVENTIGDGIVSHVFDVFRPTMSKYDLQYWSYLINNENVMGKILIKSTNASTMMTNLVSKDFLKQNIIVPNSYEEEKKIGQFLNEFDSLIALHQRKLEHLQEQKKGLLQKMFPKNGEIVPEVRFPGFTDAWEQRKWADSINISNEMVDPTTGKFDDMPHIAPGNIESFTGRILDNVKTVKEEELISGKFLFKPGDVVFGKINPQLGKYFYARVEGLTSADSYVLNGKNKNITQKFIFLLLQTRDFFKYSVSVSKRSGIPKINREELNGYKFLIPYKEEQEKIGDFFLNIDSLITLHQRKPEYTSKLT